MNALSSGASPSGTHTALCSDLTTGRVSPDGSDPSVLFTSVTSLACCAMQPDASPDPPPPLVLLATGTDCWEVDEDAPLLLPALRALGVNPVPAIWHDRTVDWAAADLVVVRSTWDYTLRRDEFIQWAESVALLSELANPPAVLRWNTDKRYLEDLERDGIAVVRTAFLSGAETGAEEIRDALTSNLGPSGEVVVKPSISAGSKDTGRFGSVQLDAAVVLAQQILRGDRTAMIQPYLPSVDQRGETGLVYFAGRYSHAFNKGPLLAPGGETEHGLFALESISEHRATEAELAAGAEILDLVTARFGAAPLYSRVDLVEDPHGEPVLLELELTEPSWFLTTDASAPARAAAALVDHLRKSSSRRA